MNLLYVYRACCICNEYSDILAGSDICDPCRGVKDENTFPEWIFEERRLFFLEVLEEES